jgi:hypothetical protein
VTAIVCGPRLFNLEPFVETPEKMEGQAQLRIAEMMSGLVQDYGRHVDVEVMTDFGVGG